MSATPEFSLDRNYSEANNIDAQGRKWQIHSSRQYPGLVWARPNPDREDAQIPKQFEGKWTSKERLQKQLSMYLKSSWNHAEAAKAKAQRVAQAAKENKPAEEVLPQKTAEESLAELPQEMKDLLGDVIAIEKPVAKKKPAAKKVAKKAT